MIISEQVFISELRLALVGIEADGVTGPGRSGAVAAVYASYALGIPFVPYGQPFPGTLLLIDTVAQSGKTIRKAQRKLEKAGHKVIARTIYAQCERLHFWYEQLTPSC